MTGILLLVEGMLASIPKFSENVPVILAVILLRSITISARGWCMIIWLPIDASIEEGIPKKAVMDEW